MDRIVVKKDYQNIKIGTNLYKHLENICKKQKVVFLACEINV